MGRLEEIRQRLLEIRALINNGEEMDIDALEQEVRELNDEKAKLEKRSALAATLNSNPDLGESRGSFEAQPQPLKVEDGKPKLPELRTMAQVAMEKRDERGAKLKEALRGGAMEKTGVNIRMYGLESAEERVQTVGSSTIVLPTAFSQDIKDVFNQVSMLVDMVRVMPLPGGESYQKPWVDDYGTGAETALNANSTDVETTFDYSVINKSLITAFQDWPREITKLANAPYETFVTNGITVAMRKRINRQILFGDGTANNLVGIFNTGANMRALDAANDVEIAAITNTTLDEIFFGYGGDEDVEMMPTLILNKLTLQQFSQIRTTDGFPYYKIMFMTGNTGTLSKMDGSLMINFVINSNCPTLAAATSGDYVAAYGSLSNYELAIFSDAEVMRSEDFRFKTRQISYSGEVYVGGNVVKKDGFLRIKKA